MTLGEKIYALRRQKGLTQEGLAKLVGVSRQAVHKWETDRIQPSIDKINLLSDVLEVNKRELLILIYNLEGVESSYKETKIPEKNENAITNNQADESKPFFCWLDKYGVRLIIISTIILIALISTTIWFGVILFLSNDYDMSVANYKINIDMFIVILVITIINFGIESVLFIFIINNRLKNK